MYVLDESTNIAANLHCLCWSFIWPPARTISLCILGKFFVSKWSKSGCNSNYHQFPANNIG